MEVIERKVELINDKFKVSTTTVDEFECDEYIREVTSLEMGQDRNQLVVDETQVVIDLFNKHKAKAEEMLKAKKEAMKKVIAEAVKKQ